MITTKDNNRKITLLKYYYTCVDDTRSSTERDVIFPYFWYTRESL